MGKNLWVGQPPGGLGPSNWTSGAIHPHVDVIDSPEGIKIYVELAGVTEQDIQLALHNGILTVYGEKRPHNREEWEQSRYLAERAFGAFRRSINLPYGLDEDAAEASFNNGVLLVTIPWTSDAPPGSKTISVKPR